jgi:hypothetical protein
LRALKAAVKTPLFGMLAELVVRSMTASIEQIYNIDTTALSVEIK